MPKYEKFMFQADLVCGRQEGVMKEGLRRAEKVVLSGTIACVQSEKSFFVQDEKYGMVACTLIDKDANTSPTEGTTVYLLSVLDEQKKKALVLLLSSDVDDRPELNNAAFLLNERTRSKSASKSSETKKPSDLDGLSPESRSYVSTYRRLATPERDAKTKKSGKLPVKELKKVYDLVRDFLPEPTRSILGDLISRPMNSRTEQRVRILLSILTIFEKEKITPDEYRKRLNERVLGMREIKDAVCETVTASALSDTFFPLRILLVGPNGIGKETIASCIAAIRGKPYAVIPYGCFSSLPDVGGCPSLYDGAKEGAFASAFFEAGTADMTLILTSIDNATGSKDKNGDPKQILVELLSGTLNDLFLEAPIDTSKTWIIGLASSAEDIPPQVLSGFDHVFYLDSLSDEKGERLLITTEYLLPKLLKEFCLDPDKTYFSTKQLNYILSELCFDQGMDLMEGYLRSLLLYMVSHREHKLTNAMIDRILHKDRILKKPAAIVCKNIDFFDKTERKIVRKYIEASEFANGERKETAIRILNFLADMFRNTVSLAPFDYKGFMETIDKTHSGMVEAKVAGARMISRQRDTKAHDGKNVLFHGAPGVGKTTLLRSIAHAANDLPFGKISCNGVHDSSFFKGTTHSYKEASFGRILTTLCATGLHALILLDEIDKIGSNDAMVALLDLLDEKKFYDNFAGVSIDVSSVIFCASANDISKVPQPLLDRFEIIELPGYTFDQKESILHDYLLPQTLAQYDNADITFTPEAQTLLVKYCKGAGARDLLTNLQKVVELVMLEHKGEKYTVGTDDLIRYLGPVPVERAMSTKLRPGLVHGLAVGGYGGIVTDILTVHSKQDKLTGLVEGSCKESVEVAKTAAAMLCPACEDATYHTHFGIGRGGVRKDGSSAGVPLALSMLSAETKTPVDPYSAFTGELSPAGDVCAVGGVPTKIQAAIDGGCRRVIIPRDNYLCLRQEELAHFEKHLEVLPVDTLEEVYSQVMVKSNKQATV